MTSPPAQGHGQNGCCLFSSITRAFRAFFQALKALAGSAPLALLVVGAVSLLLGVTEKAIYDAVIGGGATGQDAMVPVLLGWTGLNLAAEVLLGPLTAATAVFIALRHVGGTQHSAMGGLRFATSRYGRMFLPHLFAQLSIQLGVQLLLPGLLFWTMYAFVDPVAALEGERAVLERSKQLTKGRRLTVLALIAPFLTFGLVRLFYDLELVQGMGYPAFVGWVAFWYFWTYVIMVAQSLLYIDRVGGVEALKAAAQARADKRPPAA